MAEKQTRRRGAVLEKAILDAAWVELGEKGWAGFTIDGVAIRSGAAKTVIYHRYSNRVELAEDMLGRQAVARDESFPTSGDLRTDLVSFLTGMSRFLAGPFGAAVRGVISEGDPSKRPSIFADSVTVSDVDDIVGHARGRGDLSGAPSPLAANLGHAVVMSEFLHSDAPPSDGAIAELVDTIWLPALRATS